MVHRLKTRAPISQTPNAVRRIQQLFFAVVLAAVPSIYRESSGVVFSSSGNYQEYWATFLPSSIIQNASNSSLPIPTFGNNESKTIENDDAPGIITLSASNDTQADPPPRPHPHAGARFPNGTWGYIADVKAVQRRILALYRGGKTTTDSVGRLSELIRHIPQSYLPLNQSDLEGYVCGKGAGEGVESGGWTLLTEKVKVQNNSHLFEDSKQNHSLAPPKILCGVYTTASKRSNIIGIGETYGWRCDGFFAASTETEQDIGSVDLPHEGKEEYNNMWQKTRSILTYMHDNYLDEFDFFYLCGDDTHIIVENLKAMLHSMGSQARDFPLYLGQKIPRKKPGLVYAGGGPGYVLNKVALRMFVESNCFPGVYVSFEDRILGKCFASMKVYINTSVDDTGAQTFHGMDPNFVATFDGSKRRYQFFKGIYDFWAKEWGWRAGFNLTSAQSVSFHLLRNRDWMIRHHAILYNSCPNGTVLHTALQDRMQ